MSHTDKDLPYYVRVRESGFVEHDHSGGTPCVIGTWSEQRDMHRAQRLHRASCPRYVYVTECVHNAAREQFQKQVDRARATQKSHYYVYNDARLFEAQARLLSAEAILRMLHAGYFPNCHSAKTHLVDIREVDLHLIPGEQEQLGADARLPKMVNYIRNASSPPKILRARYDASVACKVCDDTPLITCFLTQSADLDRHRYCCMFTDEEEQKRYGSRRQVRDDFTEMVKAYNTFGSLDD